MKLLNPDVIQTVSDDVSIQPDTDNTSVCTQFCLAFSPHIGTITLISAVLCVVSLVLNIITLSGSIAHCHEALSYFLLE